MGKPFKVGAQPARTNPGASGQVQRKAYNPAQTAKHAVDDEIALTEAGQEHQQPDGDIADEGGGAQGSADGSRPDHAIANPWPKGADGPQNPQGVAKKPFKL